MMSAKRLRAQGMLLLGAAGAGKSTVVQHFLDKHQAHQTPDGIIMPVVVVEVPPAPTLRAIVDALYPALGYRAEQRFSAEEIVKDLKKKGSISWVWPRSYSTNRTIFWLLGNPPASQSSSSRC